MECGEWVPQHIVYEIMNNTSLQAQDTVKMIWRPNQSGEFSLKSAFSLTREHANSSFLFIRIWYEKLPVKIIFFTLRMLRNRLPLIQF